MASPRVYCLRSFVCSGLATARLSRSLKIRFDVQTVWIFFHSFAYSKQIKGKKKMEFPAAWEVRKLWMDVSLNRPCLISYYVTNYRCHSLCAWFFFPPLFLLQKGEVFVQGEIFGWLSNSCGGTARFDWRFELPLKDALSQRDELAVSLCPFIFSIQYFGINSWSLCV